MTDKSKIFIGREWDLSKKCRHVQAAKDSVFLRQIKCEIKSYKILFSIIALLVGDNESQEKQSITAEIHIFPFYFKVI